MGIAAFHADLIIREHKFRSLPQTVHLFGRQTVQLTYAQALSLLEKHQVKASKTPVEYDRSTHLAAQTNADFISDRMFFGLLGVEEVVAIDHSDYEGAEIILDLNQPIPKSLEGCVDFLYGGSVLDNVFDPAAYLRNIARLLRSGGRLVDQNLASFNLHPYVVVSPAWLFDYFVINGFADCKIYFLQSGLLSHVYGLDDDADHQFLCDMGNAPISAAFATIVVAEKGDTSTWDRVPSQDQYRSAEEWTLYRAHLRAMKGVQRTFAVFSRPSDEELSKAPLRRTKSFRYLGLFEPFDDARALSDGDQPFRSARRVGICIIDASYGLNVMTVALHRPGIIPLCRGNATDAVAEIFNGRSSGEWVVDVGYLGDPAPDMGKDLTVTYYHLNDPEQRVQEVHLAAEAHGKTLTIPPLL